MNKRKRKKLEKKKITVKKLTEFYKEKMFTIDFSKCELSYEDIISINAKQHTKDPFSKGVFYKSFD